MATIYELRARSGLGIFAVPYRNGHPRGAIRLPDGAIVERPRDDQRRDTPDAPDDVFQVATGGVPATIHHANLGLIVGHLPLSGIFLIPSGELAAVYGAEAIPLGVESEIAP